MSDGVTVHEAPRDHSLVGFDIPKELWNEAQQESDETGRWVYDILLGWLVAGQRASKVKRDHVRKEKVK